jgi:hypothetical protein
MNQRKNEGNKEQEKDRDDSFGRCKQYRLEVSLSPLGLITIMDDDN